jgi:hypothetical protein
MINFGLAQVLTPSCDPSTDAAKSPPSYRFIYGRRFRLLPTCAIKAFSLAKNYKASPFSEPKLLIGAETRFEDEGELHASAVTWLQPQLATPKKGPN